jgi:hypothetical protein
MKREFLRLKTAKRPWHRYHAGTLLLTAAVLLSGLAAGPAQAAGSCTRLARSAQSPAQLKKLWMQNDSQSLVLIGNNVFSCSCGSRQLGGDTENRQLGGDTENRRLGGASENRHLGGDSENRQLGGDTENRQLGGDTENRRLGGASENRHLGGDSENRQLGGDTETMTCKVSPSCDGFVVAGVSSGNLRFFDGRTIYRAVNRCVRW